MSEIIERTHPGRIVKKSLEALNMSSKEFSYRTGISERTLSDLINEKGSITFDVAEKLSEFFGMDIRYWTNLQTQYTYYLFQKSYKKEIDEDFCCIKPSLSYLKKVMSINNDDDKETIVKKVRSTIKINRLVLLNQTNLFASLKEQHTSNPAHVFERNLWISLSLTLARQIQVQQYSKTKLFAYLPKIREMTIEDPEVFMPRLHDMLNECGVSLVLMPYLQKSNIYGATKWLTQDSVMLSISNRGNKADLFWFTLFHELAHVVLEHKRYILCSCSDEEDKDADNFAKNMLIPKEEWKDFIYESNFSEGSIRNFANKLKILPEIVYGRLEKEEYIKYGALEKKFNTKYQILF